jgi:conserved hypothetical protein
LAKTKKEANTSAIEQATVFLQGAQITRKMKVEVTAGKNTVLFEELPYDIREESVTATAGNEVEILSVSYKINYIKQASYSEKLQKLQEQVKAVEDKIWQCEDKLEVLALEEQFLQQNRSIGGEDGIQLTTLKEIDKYYKARQTEIRKQRFDLQKEVEKLRSEKDQLEAELGSIGVNDNIPTGQVTVELTAPKAGKVDLSISYYTSSARWTPSYEIRVADEGESAKLIGKGLIFQTTGEDWVDVPVTLSSGTPALGAKQPELLPWYLNFDAPAMRSQYQAFNAAPAMARSAMMSEAVMDEEIDYMDDQKKIVVQQAPVVQQAQTSIEFVLPPVSVPVGDEGFTAEILHHELPVVFQHYSVRKLDKDVFLLAKIEGWEKLDLLAGNVSIFLGNTYVGNTFLDPRRIEDEMELSLGRDSSVIVTRVRGKDFTAKSLLGKTKKASRQWVLTVRNTRHTPIEIKVLDQLPVSANQEITVNAIETSGAEHNVETGELCWVLQLQPGESAQKNVKYEVSYPDKQSLSLE